MKPAVVASLVAAAVVVASGWSSTGGPAHDDMGWLVISSTRDGDEYTFGDGQAYAVRLDGSRLTTLLGRESRLSPVDVAPDGRLIAYANEASNAVYLSRADGSGLRRLLPPSRGLSLGSLAFSPDGSTVAIVRYDGDNHAHLFVADAAGRRVRRLGRAGPADWSPDGSLVTFHTLRGCVVATGDFTVELTRIRGACGDPTFAPDGGSLVFETASRCAVVTRPLPGRLASLAAAPQLLPGTCDEPEWSPDGSWIAYLSPGCTFCDSAKARRAARSDLGVWVVHPDGSDRRRVGPADEEDGAVYSWSPDSTRLAIAIDSRLLVASLTGRARRIGPALASNSGAPPLWSPDGSRLTMAAQTGEDPAQIWSIRADGTDLRRITTAGVNDIVGFVQGSPAREPVAPLEPSERVLGPRLLGTRKPIGRLAADGGSVAYIADSTETDCEHVSVWTPSRARILRVSIRLPAPCDDDYSNDISVYELALAGSMVGWSTNLGCGNSGCGVDVHTARLPRADPVEVGFDDGADYGNTFLRPFDPVGRGRVLVVNSHVRVERPRGGVRRCHLQGKVDAVDSGHLAVRGEGQERLVDDRCKVAGGVGLDTRGLRTVLLDGARLIAARARALEVYDTSSGALLEQRPLQPGTVAEGADDGVVVLRRGTTVTALRLGDGRSVTFRPCRGPVLAAIGGAGLYYSYLGPRQEGRLALVPLKELEWRLKTGRSFEPACNRSSESFDTGRGPIAVAAGDLDGDGRAELVSVNEEGHSISVLEGPAFEGHRDYPLGTDPSALTLSDLDGDGHLDVVVALESANAIAILHNLGDGTLAVPRRLRAGRQPAALAAGDLDGDGAPDLVVASGMDAAVSVFMNRGDGVLRRKGRRAVGSRSSSLAVADLTGDGKADVVVDHGSNPAVTVLEGAGDGTFPHARVFATPEETTDVSVADLDGSGRPDLTIAGGCAPALMLARRVGGFTARELDEREGCQSPTLSAGDVNGDGRADLVTAESTYGLPVQLTVYLNRGNGSFAPVGTYDAPATSTTAPKVLVRDVNGDGRAELAVPVYDTHSVAVLTNTLGVCRVHRLSGLTVAEAAGRLGRAGCLVGNVRRVRALRVLRRRVVAAVPRFGAFWPNGPEVDLLVGR